MANETQKKQGCSSPQGLKRSHYHSLLLDGVHVEFDLLGKHHSFDNTGKDHIKFAVIADVHQNTYTVEKLAHDADSFDFIVSAGDMSTNSSDAQLFDLYRGFAPKAFIQALGNHELTHTQHSVV